MKVLLLLSALFFAAGDKDSKSDQILGRWISAEKDLTVEVYKVNDRYAGKVVWFDCSRRPNTPPMSQHFDTENPDPKLRRRPWLGMVVLNNLNFNGSDEWNGGTVYDPNTGRTYRTVIRMASPNAIIVRGFWGIEFLGKNMRFNKIAIK